MFENFDWGVLDSPEFKEDAVREDIVAPLLRRAGYIESGPHIMIRSKPLLHPYVMIGSKRFPVHIVPDYTLFSANKVLMILDAKAPNQPIVKSCHVEQAYSYAIHPEIRCGHFALCNGRQLAVYDTLTLTLLLLINCQEITAKWSLVEQYLSPRFLRNPGLRDFRPDFGLYLHRLGCGDSYLVFGCFLSFIERSREGLYIAHATMEMEGIDFLATFDFADGILMAIESVLPKPLQGQLRSQLFGRPYRIDADCQIYVEWVTQLLEVIETDDEQYRPLVVKSVNRVEFHSTDPHAPLDPRAIADGVQRLGDKMTRN